jgi:hypothetical protein
VKRALLVVVAACGGEPAQAVTATPQITKPIARGVVEDRVLLTGELRAGAATELSVPKTEVWELTIRWIAEDGAAVKAGERVLEFDNSAFTTGLVGKQIAVLEASSGLRAFRDVGALSIAVKGFEQQQAKIAADKATLLAAVPADLLPQKTVQDRQIDRTRTELALTKAEKDLATEKQTNALEMRVKQIELDKAKRAVDTAEKGISELLLKAPVDGVVSIQNHPWEGRRFQVGDPVQPGFTIVTLPDFSKPMEVRADLSDVDDGRIVAGAKGSCVLDAYPHEPLPCVVQEISPVARTKARQSLRRMFTVGLSIDNSDPKRMRPGMSVKIVLPGAKKTGLVVPRGAVFENPDNGKAQIRMAGGELRAVTLGACDAQGCLVESGAAEGDSVLVGAP